MRRKKWMTVILMCLLGVFVFASCDDDDDDLRVSDVPDAVLASFNSLYSGVSRVEWEREYDGSYKADFRKDNRDYEARYSATGKWLRTEIDYGRDFAALPQAVQQAYESTEYAGVWTIDDIDEIQRPDSATLYRIEIEKAGQRDIYLYFDGAGTLVDTTVEQR